MLLDDGNGIGLVGHLHNHAIDVLVGQEDGREVIVDVGGERQVGVEMHLCLPVRVALTGDTHVIVVVAFLETGLQNGSLFILPSRIGVVVERHGGINALPEVEVAVGIEALKGFLRLFAGEDITPGDTVALIDKHHLRGGECLDAEPWMLVLCVTADVGEQTVVGQHEVVHLLLFTFGVNPCAALEIPTAGLRLRGHVEIRFGVSAPDGSTPVYVGHTVTTGVIGIGATFVALHGERDTVVIHAKVFLVVGCCTPPSRTVATVGTAGHVGHFFVVDAPLFVLDAVEQVVPVDFRLVEREVFGDAALADAIAVGQFQFHWIGAPFHVRPTHLVERRVGSAVDDPYRVHPFHLRHAE